MEIRQLHINELPELQRFIHNHYQKDHILSKNKKLMDFQHLGENGYNWVICKDSNGIQAICGFIPTSQFDPNIKRRDIWGAIWSSPSIRGMGMELVSYLEDWYKPHTLGAVGLGARAEEFYRRKKGWELSVLNHYVFVNPGRLASYPKGEIFTNDVVVVHDTIPEKSEEYIVNRYFRHPFYIYRSYTLGDFSIITRRIETNGGSCLRIVDCFTKNSVAFDFCSPYALHQLCLHERVDYVDMVTNRKIVPRGLTIRQMVLPNYFEPFTHEDKPIRCAHNGGRLYDIHKADADQDRPNII